MTIAEMHVWFRQYAQQMGMQNVRAILPEQIDNLINTSTKDTIDEVINRNVGVTNDRVITDNSKLANINALRTLYKVKTLPIGDSHTVNHYGNNPYTFTSGAIGDVLYFVDFSIRYSNEISNITTKRSTYNYCIIACRDAKEVYAANPTNDNEVLFRTALSNLEIAEQELREVIENNTTLTRWFPIRVVDDAYLADILNDWVLAPRMRTPIMVIYGDTLDTVNSTFELYVGENQETGMASITSAKYIAEIRCSYIRKPNTVKYLYDVGGQNVDSDLPEQLQIPMLKHAVDLYRASVSGNLFANQENAKENQREMVRNQARPDNEGYQS